MRHTMHTSKVNGDGTPIPGEREHIMSADCWCNPRTEYVPPRKPLRAGK